jgi:phosphatidylinositol-3-phosphatase
MEYRSIFSGALLSVLAAVGSRVAPAAPGAAQVPAAGAPGRPDHVLIVIEENRDAVHIAGSPDAPYLNALIKGGLYFANAHGVDHDSQPNYLEMFCGANPGPHGLNWPLRFRFPDLDVRHDELAEDREEGSDAHITDAPFHIANLGAQLRTNGFSFAGYSESMPSTGFTGYTYADQPGQTYARKHNPWVNWQAKDDANIGPDELPSSTNLPYTAFPAKFSNLPTVSFVVPNLANDMHDAVSLAGEDAVHRSGHDEAGRPVDVHTTIQHGDAWLKDHLDAYRRWATTHHSLLLITWDENDDDFGKGNDIPIIVVGDPALVQPGENNQYVNHFTILRLLEDTYGLPHAGYSAMAGEISRDQTGKLISTSDKSVK